MTKQSELHTWLSKNKGINKENWDVATLNDGIIQRIWGLTTI